MKSPEVSICFAFWLSVSLCGTNQEQIFHLPKSSWMMVCAMSLLLPNSSTINLSISHWSSVSICRTFQLTHKPVLRTVLESWNSSKKFLHDSNTKASFHGNSLQVGISQSFMGFCLSMADPNVAHPQSFPSLHESVWPFVNTFSAYGFTPYTCTNKLSDGSGNVGVCENPHITLLHCSFPNL